MKQTTTFKRSVLPRYLRCSETVKEELTKGGDAENAEFFASRYSEGELYKEAIEQTLDKLKALKKNVPNVFIETE